MREIKVIKVKGEWHTTITFDRGGVEMVTKTLKEALEFLGMYT